MIQALNREQPRSGVLAIECSSGCGCLTVRWLCQGAAEAKKRNERNLAGGWHILLCALKCKAVAKPEHWRLLTVHRDVNSLRYAFVSTCRHIVTCLSNAVPTLQL